MNLLPQLLAFTPLIDPLPAIFPNLDDNWLWFVVPLVLAISIVYKGTRVGHLRRLPIEALLMSVQILILMVGASAALYGIAYVWLHAS